MSEIHSIKDLEATLKELDKLQDDMTILASPRTKHSIAWQELGGLAQQEIQAVIAHVQTIKNRILGSMVIAKQKGAEPIVDGLDQDVTAVKKRHKELVAKYREAS